MNKMRQKVKLCRVSLSADSERALMKYSVGLLKPVMDSGPGYFGIYFAYT